MTIEIEFFGSWAEGKHVNDELKKPVFWIKQGQTASFLVPDGEITVKANNRNNGGRVNVALKDTIGNAYSGFKDHTRTFKIGNRSCLELKKNISRATVARFTHF